VFIARGFNSGGIANMGFIKFVTDLSNFNLQRLPTISETWTLIIKTSFVYKGLLKDSTGSIHFIIVTPKNNVKNLRLHPPFIVNNP